MRPRHLILPIISIIIGLVWLKHQESRLIEITQKVHTIQNKMGIKQGSETSTSKRKTAKPSRKNQSVNWKAIAKCIVKEEAGFGDIKTMLTFMGKLRKMSADEIEAQFKKLAELNLGEEAEMRIKSSLIDRMSEISSEKALHLIQLAMSGNGADDTDFVSSRIHIFNKFTTEDSAAAADWLDQRVKEGHFPAKGLDPWRDPLFKLERDLIAQLIHDDKTAAQARLDLFNKEEKKMILMNYHKWRKDGKMPEDYISIAREHLSEKDATTLIAQAWSVGSNIELKDLSKSLSEIEFSPQEASALVIDGAKNFILTNKKGDRYAEGYQWAKKYNPANAGKALSLALSSETEGGAPLSKQFQKALKFAKTYNDPTITSSYVARIQKLTGPHFYNTAKQIKDPELAKKFISLAAPTE